MKRLSLSWLIEKARCKFDCGAVDAFLWKEIADECDAEVFVCCTTEATEIMICGGPYEIPVDEISRAVEDGLDVSALKVASLDDGVNGL